MLRNGSDDDFIFSSGDETMKMMIITMEVKQSTKTTVAKVIIMLMITKTIIMMIIVISIMNRIMVAIIMGVGIMMML